MAARLYCILLLAAIPFSANSKDNSFRIAVAANFKKPLDVLITDYHKQHPNVKIRVSSGASGSLYHQVVHGAPYQLFMSADDRYPSQLEKKGYVAEDKQHHILRDTYAFGRIVLWHPGIKINSLKALKHRKLILSIANPKLAPYGKAALETLHSLSINNKHLKIVHGHSIGQAYQLVQSGNAQAGILANSLLHNKDSIINIDNNLHQPIHQQMVLLKPFNSQAYNFYQYMLTDTSQAIIRNFGYQTTLSNNVKKAANE